MMKEIIICGTVMNGSTCANKALTLKLDAKEFTRFATRNQLHKAVIKKAIESQVFGLDPNADNLEVKWGDFISNWQCLRKLARAKQKAVVMSPSEKLKALKLQQDAIWEQINKLYSKLDSIEPQIKQLEAA